MREAGGFQVRLDLCLAAPPADWGIGDREEDERWLVPPVGEEAGLMPPVLLWWVLLLGLSLLARYEPAAWQAALDLDISPAADPLTQLLDDALTAVPALLFDAATRGPGT